MMVLGQLMAKVIGMSRFADGIQRRNITNRAGSDWPIGRIWFISVHYFRGVIELTAKI